MKHANIMGLVCMLLVGDTRACDSTTHHPENPNNPVGNQKNLRFFAGSVRECTTDDARAGLCSPSRLTRCITLENHYGENLACKVVARARLHSAEENFTRLYTVTARLNVSAQTRQDVTCFDFNALDLPSWTLERFTSFQGHCQDNPTSNPPTHWECDPEKTLCTSFEYDSSTCLEGWPCLKLYVHANSIKRTTCTDELVRQGVCSTADTDAFVCVTSSNRGPAALRCDLRLNVKLQGESGPSDTSSLLRGSMFYAGDEDELCFRINGVADINAVYVQKMNAVCRQADPVQDLSRICDLSQNTCDTESKVIEYLE